MKKGYSIAFSILVLLSACNSRSKTGSENDSYEQAKESLAEKEKKNPLKFLSASCHDKRNLLGQTVIKGTVTNKATVCIYKDVQLELSFYSKTGTLLEKDNETVYESITPGNSSEFKTKYFAPKGTDSVAVKITGAKTN